MPRSIYRKVNGEWVWQEIDNKPVELPLSAAVHDDTFREPLKHPVTGEVIDSGTRWEAINKELGLECVGNDLLSKRPRRHRDRVTEADIKDAMEHAEAITSDPVKKRAWYNEQEALNERNEKLLNKIH